MHYTVHELLLTNLLLTIFKNDLQLVGQREQTQLGHAHHAAGNQCFVAGLFMVFGNKAFNVFLVG